MLNYTSQNLPSSHGVDHEPGGSGIIGVVAEYIVDARSRRSAERARQAALKCILDLVGAAGAGFGEPGASAVRGLAVGALGSGDAPVWFAGRSCSAIGAAWANSAAASILDLDDGHRLARGHPGAAVIPTAFAVGHETGATLEDILTAIVIGYEVGVTVAAARLTYGNTGTWSSYAVVATAAALRGTSRETIEHALAIAGESAPNQLFASAPAQTPAPEGSDVKEGIPWSVVTGLVALGLAEAGHTGPRNILDGALHYRFPADLSLGKALHICTAYFKLYACCRHVHAPLDALLQLVDRHDLRPSSIDGIEVETYSGALRISNKTYPTNLVDIQYSIPFCLALVAISGPKSLLPLTSDALSLAGASSLAKKVSLSLNPAFDARFPAETLARVTVICAGERFVSDVTAPKGEATNPLSWTELEEKFDAVTRLGVKNDQIKQLLSSMSAARDGDLSKLTTCLAEIVFQI